MNATVHAVFAATAARTPQAQFIFTESVTARAYGIAPGALHWGEAAARRAFIRELNARLEKLPDIEGVAISNDLPIRGSDWLATPVVEGRPPFKPGEGISVGRHTVNDAYFQAMKIPLLRGRALTERDDENAPLAVVINESTASALWPGAGSGNDGSGEPGAAIQTTLR